MSGGLKPPSQRMLKVGEELRHALAEIFIRGECHAPELYGVSITVSEVRMTPDLKLGTAYIATLGTRKVEEILPLLNKKYDKTIRKLLSGKIHLKFLPQVRFRMDESFDEAQKIHRLLYQAGVSQVSVAEEGLDEEL
jgi:ribosome-binding factor A